MPTLILEDVPVEIYDRIQQQALSQNRTISAEAVRVLRQGLSSLESMSTDHAEHTGRNREVSRRLPDPPFLTEEVSAPCDLPRPGAGVQVRARRGGVRLPDQSSFPEDQS